MDLLHIQKFVLTYKCGTTYNINSHKKNLKKKLINIGLANKDMYKMKNYVSIVRQHVLIWERLF